VREPEGQVFTLAVLSRHAAPDFVGQVISQRLLGSKRALGRPLAGGSRGTDAPVRNFLVPFLNRRGK
jgi:hypothetical protein